MVTRYDEKGKFFTDVVSKENVPVIMQLTTGRIKGYVYVRAGSRLIDELNQAEQFIAVTNAEVFDQQDNLLYRAKFMTLNFNQVIWVIPERELFPVGINEESEDAESSFGDGGEF